MNRKNYILISLLCLLSSFVFAKRLDDSGNYLVRYQGDEVVILECYIKDAETIQVPETFKNIPVTRIASGAFKSSINTLQTVVLPDTVKELGAGIFSDCTKLKNVNIPASLVRIPESAFSNCSSLESIKLPESLMAIDSYAFFKCTNLKTVNIPYSVRVIGENAFKASAVDEVFIARPTHIEFNSFEREALLYVFRDSQAASAVIYADGEYLYVNEGVAGDIADYDDYQKWGGSRNGYYLGRAENVDDDYYYDDNDDYEEEDEDVPEVSAEQLATLVKTIAKRENLGYKGIATDGSEGVYYVKFEHSSSCADTSGDFPYIYYLLEGTDSVPNLLYVVFGRNTSDNKFVYSMAASSLLETEDEKDIRDEDELDDLYDAIQGYTIAYQTKVSINGLEYDVYCTDIDED